MTDTILPQTSLPQSDGAAPRPSSPRPSSSRPAVIVALVIALVIVAGIGGYELLKSPTKSSPAAPPVVAAKPGAASPLSTVLAQVMANATAQKYVHDDATLKAPKHPALAYADDDGVTGGIQRISIANGGSATVIVVGSTTYLSGDRLGLAKLFGLNPTQVTQVLGHWIRLVPGNPEYAAVTDGITLAATLKEIELSGPLTRLPQRTLHGRQVFGIRGALAGGTIPGAHATVWISVGNHGLPVEFVAAGAKTTETVRFSHWGHPVIAHAPRAGALGSGTLSG
jgi:hypothetical protein